MPSAGTRYVLSRVSKSAWRIVAVEVRFQQRQILILLVDGASLFTVRMISTTTPSAIRRPYDTVNAQMTRPTAVYASGANYSCGERLLVVGGEDLDVKCSADSTRPVLAEGAGGRHLL